MEDPKVAQIKPPPSSLLSPVQRNNHSLVANDKVEFQNRSPSLDNFNSENVFGNIPAVHQGHPRHSSPNQLLPVENTVLTDVDSQWKSHPNQQQFLPKIATTGISSNGQEAFQASDDGMLAHKDAYSTDRSRFRIDNEVGSPFSSPRISSQLNQCHLPQVKVRPQADEAALASPETPRQVYSPDARTPSPASDSKLVDISRGLIDTTAPFESVKEAATKFGGAAHWKAHKSPTVERRKLVEQELVKVQEEMPEYRRETVDAEVAKTRILKELESTKILIESLKLSLERAQTEEHQAKRDSERARIRFQELERGSADEASVVAKAQLEVAEARHTTAVSETKSVNYELEALRKEYASLVAEKDEAVRKAEEAISRSKEVEKIVEGLTIELIATKESLESAHAAHLEAEEQKIGETKARQQDALHYGKELKQAQEELQKLNLRVLSGKDLKVKLDTATNLLLDLKAELATYMESKIEDTGKRNTDAEKQGLANRTRTDVQATVASAKKELEEVKFNIQKATDEVNCLKVAATSLQSEMEKYKSALATGRQREGMEKMVEFPKQLQKAEQAADKAKQLAQRAQEEMYKAKEEAEQAKAEASTMESKLFAAQKEIEAAKASEKLALAAIKALQESESAQSTKVMDSQAGITLSLEQYYELSKRAHDAEESMKASAAMEFAKDSGMKPIDKVEDVKREITTRREAPKEKAEKAQEEKPDDDQRRKTGELYQGAGKSPRPSFEGKNEANTYSGEARDESPEYVEATKGDEHETNTDDESDEKHQRKKRRSFFPRFLMFFTRKRFLLPFPGKAKHSADP